MRIDRALGNSGYGTRKEIKELIRSGKVMVNGEVIKNPGTHVNPDEDIISIDGKEVRYRKYVYLMLNKPMGVITATRDNKHKTFLDIIPEKYLKFNLSSAGRLDIDTEGLLMLTNNGPLIHELITPGKQVDKTYFAIIIKEAGEDDIESFSRGVVLDDGYKTMPAVLEYAEEDKHKIFLTIKEGKYHQVKRMFEAVGKKVLYLKRIRMANIYLDDSLNPGECRELTDDEICSLEEYIKRH